MLALLLSACVSLAGLIDGSACKAESGEPAWSSRTGNAAKAAPTGRRYHLAIHDAAQQTGVTVGGDIELELRARG